MNDETTTRMPRWRDWAAILTAFAASVFGATYLGKIGTRAANIESALVIASGTAALAALTRRFSGFPAWASIASVLVLGGSAILGALFWPDVSSWRHMASGSLWMHPWYFLTLVGIRPGRSVCAGAIFGGWAILTGAFVIAAMVPLIGVFL